MRQRIYLNDAEKMRAYRARKKRRGKFMQVFVPNKLIGKVTPEKLIENFEIAEEGGFRMRFIRLSHAHKELKELYGDKIKFLERMSKEHTELAEKHIRDKKEVDRLIERIGIEYKKLIVISRQGDGKQHAEIRGLIEKLYDQISKTMSLRDLEDIGDLFSVTGYRIKSDIPKLVPSVNGT